MNTERIDTYTRKQRILHVWGPNATVFVASACVMIVEIVAGRIISRYLGQSLYTWISVIGVVLAGIYLGNYIGGRWADRFAPARMLSGLFLMSALLCMGVPAINHLAGNSLFLLERAWPTRIFLHVLLTFIMPSCALGAISPIVVKIALTHTTTPGRTIGNVYAWGAAGSIAGTFLAGFYLIAVMRTFGVIALVALILTAMGLCYALGSWVSRVGLFIAVIVLVGAVGKGETAHAIGRCLYFKAQEDDEVLMVYEKESPYSYVSVQAARQKPNLRVMILDTLWHSVIDVDDPVRLAPGYTWIYEGMINKYSPAGEPVSALIIGGGGYVMPQYLEITRPGSRIHVAEIDPLVTEAAFIACGLKRDTTMEIHNIDARNYVEDLIRERKAGGEQVEFDYILGDTVNHYYVPYHLTTREFNDRLYELLAPGGLYLFNIPDIYESGRFLGAMVKTLQQTFPYLYVISFSNKPDTKDRFIVAGSKIERDLSDLPTLIREKYPAYKGFICSRERLEALADASDVRVFTDNYAPAEYLLSDVVHRSTDDLLKGRMTRRYPICESCLIVILSIPVACYNRPGSI